MCQSKENVSGILAGERCCKYDITTSQNELPRLVRQKYLKSKYKENISFYQNTVMHGYLAKSIENDPKIDHKTTNRGEEMKIWFLNSRHITLLSKTRKLLRSTRRQNGRKKIHQTPS